MMTETMLIYMEGESFVSVDLRKHKPQDLVNEIVSHDWVKVNDILNKREEYINTRKIIRIFMPTGV